MSQIRQRWKTIIWLAIVFFSAFDVYMATVRWGYGWDFSSPDTAYFNHLAAAFLRGQIYLENPLSTQDLTFANGHWYVPFPPVPAILMIPFVIGRGADGVKTVMFNAMLGAFNVALVYLLLEALRGRGWTRLGRAGNLWLAAAFGFSSVHWYLAVTGEVWFVAQICTVTFMALSAWIAVKTGSSWGAGLALAAAVATRPTVVFAWVLLLAIAAQRLKDEHGLVDWKRLAKWAAGSAIPLALAGAALLAYNAARFGSLWDFGYLNANVSSENSALLHTYGQFNMHYLAANLKGMFLGLPAWNHDCKRWMPDGSAGMSIFITTPALFYLWRAVKREPLVIGAWLSVGLLIIPVALYYTTGAWQFGYRFSLDFMVPLIVLLAIAAGKRVSWLLALLILFGMVVNASGVAFWYNRWCILG